jgi:hypothetical protein
MTHITPELHPEFLERISAINWFHRCGQEDEIIIKVPYHFTESWKEAQKLYRHRDWEKIQMLGQNSISGYPYDNHIQILTDYWNPLAIKVREFVLTTVTPKAQDFAEKNSLHPVFVNRVQ